VVSGPTEQGGPVTFVNVFTVAPADQDRLIGVLARATEGTVRQAPGFISARLHRGTDGSKVVMYAQWRSLEDYQAMRDNQASQPYLQEALTFARFDPGTYEIVQEFVPAAPPAN
jgi:quinol monooxygenase YgiN